MFLQHKLVCYIVSIPTATVKQEHTPMIKVERIYWPLQTYIQKLQKKRANKNAQLRPWGVAGLTGGCMVLFDHVSEGQLNERRWHIANTIFYNPESL